MKLDADVKNRSLSGKRDNAREMKGTGSKKPNASGHACLRIVHVVTNLDNSFGGPANCVPLLSYHLMSLGVDSTLAAVQKREDESNEVIDRYGLPFHAMRASYPSAAYYSRHITKFLKGFGAECIIHLHSMWSYPAFAACRASSFSGAPFVVSIRSGLYPESLRRSRWKKAIAWRAYVERMLRNAVCLHATGSREVEVVRRLGFKTPVALVPEGVDLDIFDRLPTREAAKDLLELPTNRRYALFLSRIHPTKGLDKLFDAFARVAAAHPSWDILVVGPCDDSSYWNAIAVRVHQLKLNSRVKFLGALTGYEKVAAYRSSELLVVPTIFENFGLVMAEAMVAGRAIITTKGAPWPQIQEEGCGWWIDLEEGELTRTLVQAFCESTAALDARGERGKGVVSQFTWTEQASKMLWLYEWIKGRRERPPFVCLT